MHQVFAFLLFICTTVVTSREWNNTGRGLIAFEEAWTVPELLIQVANSVPAFGQTKAELEANLLDVHDQRLTQMNENGIDFMVLSCASPCIQGFSDPPTAEALATSVNDVLAATISNNTMRFGAFAALSMHNATQAAQELNRTVTELGFLGALLNDYQQSGDDNTTLLYYDQPEYDVFWQMVVDLDVPVYMHPRVGISLLNNLEYQQAVWLIGPGQQFAASLSNHILGICTNGVFDRFPTLKLIVGHLGERITSDLFRIDEQLQRQRPEGMPMKLNVSTYWETNLFETTSANFATPLLKFHIDAIGLDRIMFSIDYPYASIPEGAQWIEETLPDVLSPTDLLKLKRETAIQVLGLNK
ncbi:hypothetical protein Clacol_009235 [Clathrus columnatus]|uniref:Amidohydrolase-related domain-containing protein n=1 Tax=Clathrus columnatus TaxID=1419009 RepID=A0AAV5AST5_9AGAM|nr:hypothetical protein Clacol_009235 [Clathrus columnatus]